MTARLSGLTIVALLALAAPAQAAERICHGQYAKPVLPPTHEQDELHRYAQARAGYGFRDDLAYIRQLIARRQWASRFDIPVTPAEDRYIKQRERLALGAAGERYLSRRTDVSTGLVSIEDDWPRRPYLLVGFTRDVEANLAALRRVARFPRQVRAKKVRFSVRDLLRISDRISNDEQALRRAGFNLVEVATLPSHGRVELDMITRRADYRAYFAARYGPGAYVRERKRTATVTECAPASSYSVSADGRTLTLRLPTNSQEKKADHVELAEFPDRVVVGAVEQAPTFPSSSREDEREISVKLAGPLGSRQVIDAGSLRRVRLEGPNPGDPLCPPFPASQFEAVTQERQEAGLPSDPASVQRHIDSNGQLTPDEQRWADQQPNVEPTEAVYRYLRVHRDEYVSNVRVGDFPAPRRMVYRFSGHAAEHEAALKRIVRRPELMSTETVPYTLVQLRAVFDRLRRDKVLLDGFFDGYGRAGFFVGSIRPDDPDGVVDLEVVGVRADAAPYFTAAYGPLVRVEVVGDRYECARRY